MTPALLTRTGSQTSLGFSPIVGVPAVIKHNLSLIRKYHRFLFLLSLRFYRAAWNADAVLR